jgi:uncharacterized protein involved in cysteine biosynthesis
MTELPRAFALSLGQLSDPAMRRVLGKSLLATLAIFAALGLAAWQGLSAVTVRYVSGYEGLSALVAALLTVIGAWLLFRVVALAVLQFFADDVVRAVERRHYSAAASKPDLPFWAELAASARSLLRVLAVNAVALPLALVLLVTGVGTALLLWAANAWLLGRELTEMVRLRHRAAAVLPSSSEEGPGVVSSYATSGSTPPPTPSSKEEGADAAAPIPVSGLTRFLLGGIVAALLIVPLVNLLAPVLGAAAATHLVHGARGMRG